MLADIFGKESEDQIAVLLKQGIFTTISPVGVCVTQMLATVRRARPLDRVSRTRTCFACECSATMLMSG